MHGRLLLVIRLHNDLALQPEINQSGYNHWKEFTQRRAQWHPGLDVDPKHSVVLRHSSSNLFNLYVALFAEFIWKPPWQKAPLKMQLVEIPIVSQLSDRRRNVFFRFKKNFVEK